MIDSLMRKARSRKAEMILITAKDAVKWPSPVSSDLPVMVLETAWIWQDGEELFANELRRVLKEPLK